MELPKLLRLKSSLKNMVRPALRLLADYKKIRRMGKEPLPTIKIGCATIYGVEAEEASMSYNRLMWSVLHRAPRLSGLLIWLNIL
jgi:hypothetical protein